MDGLFLCCFGAASAGWMFEELEEGKKQFYADLNMGNA